MIATNIITEERFREFLSKTIINKEYAKKLMLLFYGINDIEIQSKLMFLAYNEYKCIDDVLDLVSTGDETLEDGTKKDVVNVSANLNDYINSSGIEFDTPYKYIRQYHFRDYVTTMTREKYQSYTNMEDQAKVIFKALTNNEQKIVTAIINQMVDSGYLAEFDLGDSILMNFIRYPHNEETPGLISLSRVETSSEGLNLLAMILNDQEKTICTGDELKEILNKISRGTIN